MRLFHALILLLYSSLAAAGSTNAGDIKKAAQQFLEAYAQEQRARDREVEYTVGSLDSRLQLAACGKALAFEFVSEPEKSVRNTLLVSCSGDRPWRLFLNAEIEISSEAFVAATPLSRGARITEAMLRRENVIINQARGGVFHKLDGLLGMEIRRPLREGTLLSPSVLTAPETVARGDFVKIQAQSGPITIETRGTAIASGMVGDQILVENARSGRQVRGVIVGPGHVRVVM